MNMLCDVHPNYIYKDAQAHMHKCFLASMMVSLLLFYRYNFDVLTLPSS